MSALTLNGNDFPVRRDGFAWSLERTQDKGRAVNGALRVAVMGTPRRVIEARSIPLPWATAQVLARFRWAGGRGGRKLHLYLGVVRSGSQARSYGARRSACEIRGGLKW